MNIITDIISDPTLYQYCRTAKLNMHITKSICKQLLSTLSYIHEQGMIYSMLSPSEIFINRATGKICINDFVNTMDYPSFHDTRSLVGYSKLAFMPAEIFTEGYQSNFSTDIYAFGMTVLSLITSDTPYTECKSAIQNYLKKVNGEPPATLTEITDETAQNFINLCINQNPSERPTAKTLLNHPFLESKHNDKTVLVTYLTMSKFDRFCHTASFHLSLWENVSVDDLPLDLMDEHQYLDQQHTKITFTESIIESLNRKKTEYQKEYASFLSTQIKLHRLKVEAVNNKWGINTEERLVNVLTNKIKDKQQCIKAKWNELVQDQKEILVLRRAVTKLFQTDKVKANLIVTGWVRLYIQSIFGKYIPDDVQFIIYYYYWLKEDWHPKLHNKVIIERNVCKTDHNSKISYTNLHKGGTVFGMNVIKGGCHRWIFKTSNILYKTSSMNIGIEPFNQCKADKEDRIGYSLVVPYLHHIEMTKRGHDTYHVTLRLEHNR